MNTKLHAGLSDLFFNHTHDQYDDACRTNRTLKPDQRDPNAESLALLEDAKEFCQQLANAYNITEDPAELARDFLERL